MKSTRAMRSRFFHAGTAAASLLTACVFGSLAAHAQDLDWRLIGGTATDIAAGADGSIWLIGNDAQTGGYGIYKYTGSTWERKPGAAVHVAVDPQGKAWVVNASHQIFRWNGRGWEQMPGEGTDIGAGANGDVWLIGTDHAIWKWDPHASWQKKPGAADRVAVDPNGVAWIVNSAHSIYRWNGSNWTRMPGAAIDVGVGAEGSVWVIGTDGAPWKYNGIGWTQATGILASIAVDNHGNPWGVNPARQVWASVPLPAPTAFQKGYLGAGESLTTGQYLQSPAKTYFTVLQADGNLCTYAGTPRAQGAMLWCDMRTAPGGHFVMVMRTDGSLCTYRGTYKVHEEKPTWCASDSLSGGQFRVVQQDDGNLCVYSGSMPAMQGSTSWCRATNTVPSFVGGYTSPSEGTYVQDTTKSAFVWLTVYHTHGGIDGADCLPPGATTHIPGTSSIDHIRAEFTHTVGCAHPVSCDTSLAASDIDRYAVGRRLTVGEGAMPSQCKFSSPGG